MTKRDHHHIYPSLGILRPFCIRFPLRSRFEKVLSGGFFKKDAVSSISYKLGDSFVSGMSLLFLFLALCKLTDMSDEGLLKHTIA
jgi:hypothetical protein